MDSSQARRDLRAAKPQRQPPTCVFLHHRFGGLVWLAALAVLAPTACVRVFSSNAPEKDCACVGPLPVDAIRDIADDAVDAPADAASDRGPIPMACPWDRPFTFSTPVRVSELSTNTSAELEPYLADKGLTLYFASLQRPGGLGDWDSYSATRPSLGAPFTGVRNQVEVNSPKGDTRFAVTLSGLRAYLATERAPGKSSDIWLARRQTTSQRFALVAPIRGINDSSAAEYDPFPSADDLRIFFSSDGPLGGSGKLDLMVASRPTLNNAFTTPRPIRGVNSSSSDDNPWLSKDERLLVFSSDRGGDYDIYFAFRAGAKGRFASPKPVPGLNVAGRLDSEAFVRADGCEVFFVSDRRTAGKRMQIFRALWQSP